MLNIGLNDNLSVRKLEKQMWAFGTVHSYASPNLNRKGKLFIFNEGTEFIEKEFSGLE